LISRVAARLALISSAAEDQINQGYPATFMVRKAQKLNFEASITALEELVKKMEGGEFSLEESLAQFERGISLARACQQALREAEQKVVQLTKDANGGETLIPFEPANDG